MSVVGTAQNVTQLQSTQFRTEACFGTPDARRP